MRYEELLRRQDAPPGSSWGLCGDIGSVSFLGADQALEATACVRRGVVFNLDWPVNGFNPPLARNRSRKLARHTIYQLNPNHRDDYLDSFYLQGTSQLDGLRHQRHSKYGFYNGVPDEAIAVGEERLGIGQWAARGIVGRGVLVDIDRYLIQTEQRRLDFRAGEMIPVSTVERAAERQGVRFRPGDVLMLRTGWAKFYLEELSAPERQAVADAITSPGLSQEDETLRWLWDRQFSVIAADNYAVECLPPNPSSPFDDNPRGLLHPSAIALLGLALGELWRLEELAADCAQDGRYECMVTAKPLFLDGGVGSPPNAMAIK